MVSLGGGTGYGFLFDNADYKLNKERRGKHG
jgi:hypothetical protein